MTAEVKAFPRTLFFVKKHVPDKKRPLKQALQLFNDGKNLYVVGEDGSNTWLKYSDHWREVSCMNIPGADFSGQEVMFRTFGHTINGSVVVSVREKKNNWVVTILIGINQRVQLGDSYLSVVATRLA